MLKIWGRKNSIKNLEAWYQRVLQRPAFKEHCAAPLN